MRVIETSPDDPVTAGLLTAYFAERVDGFTAGRYRVASPDPAQFVPPGLFLRIDEDDGAPLACGGVREIEPDDGRRFEVKHLFVSPAARGSGLGRRLLSLLEAHVRREGASWLVLDTNRSLQAAAGLYRSSGFLPVAPFNDNPNATDWYAKELLPTA
jgi:ribosomal protein S18 acetylase RimI-like enzyme